MEDLSMIGRNLLNIIPNVVILGACIYYTSRMKSTEGVLLVIGSITSLLSSGFYMIALPLLSGTDSSFYFDNMFLMTAIGGAATIGHVLFAIGLVMLVINTVKRSQQTNTGF